MKKGLKVILGSVMVISLLKLGESMAYFSDVENKSNVFTVGSVEITLHEDGWDALEDTNDNSIPDMAENITPNKVITKDPAIENTGKNDAYVYLEVKVPFKNVITADAQGTRNPIAKTELFSYNVDTTKWTQLSRVENSDDVTYIYSYNETLKPNTTTSTLFDEVTFANVIEGQGLENQNLEIQVKGIAIQSEDSGNVNEAYQKYVSQNQ